MGAATTTAVTSILHSNLLMLPEGSLSSGKRKAAPTGKGDSTRPEPGAAANIRAAGFARSKSAWIHRQQKQQLKS